MKCPECGKESLVFLNGVCLTCAKETDRTKICKKCGKYKRVLFNGICEQCAYDLGFYAKMNEGLEKRLKHLLESDYIRSFDEKNLNGGYKRDIKEADAIAKNGMKGQVEQRSTAKIAMAAGVLETIGCMEGAAITVKLANEAEKAGMWLRSLMEE